MDRSGLACADSLHISVPEPSWSLKICWWPVLSREGLDSGGHLGEDVLAWGVSDQCWALSWNQGKKTNSNGTASGSAIPSLRSVGPDGARRVHWAGLPTGMSQAHAHPHVLESLAVILLPAASVLLVGWSEGHRRGLAS